MKLPAPLRSLLTWVRGGSRAFEATQADRRLSMWLDSLNFDQLKRALGEWSQGNPREIGHVFEQLRKLPVLRAVTRQALSAVKAVEFEINPPKEEGLDPKRVQASADLFRLIWERISESLIDTVVRIRWEGGGFYEPTWIEDDKGRVVPVGIRRVALQRVRRDVETGKPTFALHSYDAVGVPLDTYPPGVFFAVDPENDVQDFSCRGEFVAALTDLWRLREILAFWAQGVEKSESPTAHLKAGNEADRKIMVKAAENWGNGGRFVTSKESEIALVQKQQRSAFDPHDLYEQRAKARLAGLFLGSELTLTVAPDQASKQAAGEHAKVADDTMQETCLLVAHAANELARFVALLNEGDERYASTLKPDLDGEPDAGLILDNYGKAKALGVTTSEEQLREQTGLRRPGKGETPIPGDHSSADVPATGPVALKEAA